MTLADVPMGFFPDDVSDAAVAAPPAPSTSPFADASPAKANDPAPSRALKIARAITGETELRLLAEKSGAEVRFTLVSSTIAPYASTREALVKPGKKKTPMNEQQAIEEFERRVASAYPPETLRNGKIVAIHLNLI
jgi:hypothetical protein